MIKSAVTILLLANILSLASAFVMSPPSAVGRSALSASSDDMFEIQVTLPSSETTFPLRFESVLPGPSEVIQVRYQIPFGLDVSPKDNLAVCTKDGPGGERIGDVLRYTSAWTLGLPMGEGLMETAAAFGGALKWQCTLFDVLKAKRWEQVVEALVSNVPQRTDEVLLIFERPMKE